MREGNKRATTLQLHRLVAQLPCFKGSNWSTVHDTTIVHVVFLHTYFLTQALRHSFKINFKYINLYLFTLLTSDKVITAWISFSLDSFNDST